MIRPPEAADAPWIAGFLREQWHATTQVVHGEIIDAAVLPALIAGEREGVATYRWLGRDAEQLTRNAEPASQAGFVPHP